MTLFSASGRIETPWNRHNDGEPLRHISYEWEHDPCKCDGKSKCRHCVWLAAENAREAEEAKAQERAA